MAGNARLPKPITTLWEWQYQGACIGMDSMRFFHPEGERGSSRRKHALATHEPYGVWGGMTEEERRAWIDREENGRGTPVA